jgi:hypothetical protein
MSYYIDRIRKRYSEGGSQADHVAITAIAKELKINIRVFEGDGTRDTVITDDNASGNDRITLNLARWLGADENSNHYTSVVPGSNNSEPSSEESIFVKLPTGETATIPYHPSKKVSEVMLEIQDRVGGWEVGDVALGRLGGSYLGRMDLTLSDYGIGKDCELKLLVRGLGGGNDDESYAKRPRLSGDGPSEEEKSNESDSEDDNSEDDSESAVNEVDDYNYALDSSQTTSLEDMVRSTLPPLCPSLPGRGGRKRALGGEDAASSLKSPPEQEFAKLRRVEHQHGETDYASTPTPIGWVRIPVSAVIAKPKNASLGMAFRVDKAGCCRIAEIKEEYPIAETPLEKHMTVDAIVWSGQTASGISVGCHWSGRNPGQASCFRYDEEKEVEVTEEPLRYTGKTAAENVMIILRGAVGRIQITASKFVPAELAKEEER